MDQLEKSICVSSIIGSSQYFGMYPRIENNADSFIQFILILIAILFFWLKKYDFRAKGEEIEEMYFNVKYHYIL